jgi:hypothetical protein
MTTPAQTLDDMFNSLEVQLLDLKSLRPEAWQTDSQPTAPNPPIPDGHPSPYARTIDYLLDLVDEVTTAPSNEYVGVSVGWLSPSNSKHSAYVTLRRHFKARAIPIEILYGDPEDVESLYIRRSHCAV